MPISIIEGGDASVGQFESAPMDIDTIDEDLQPQHVIQEAEEVE